MTVFMTTLRRIFINPLTWAFLFVFPALLFVLINFSINSPDDARTNGVEEIDKSFGVADSDGTTLSKTLINQLGTRYNIIEINEDEITEKLTSDQTMPWVLHIHAGYGESVLKGETPRLDGYSLTLSDTSALGSLKAESITKSLMLLGTDDEAVLEAWAENSKTDIEIIGEVENWGQISYWFGFFGFVSLFVAYFIIKPLTDDKRGGMPDRIGVLPTKTRSYLIQGSLAAFLTTEITVFLSMGIIALLLGAVGNPLLLFLILSLYNLFAICFVMAIVSFSRDLGVVSVTLSLIGTITAMLGGVFWPLDLVPEFMRKLAWFSPGYWLSQGIQNVLNAEKITFEGYVMPVLFLLAFTAVTVLVGGWKKVQKMEE